MQVINKIEFKIQLIFKTVFDQSPNGFESIAQFAAALTPQRWLLINALKGIGHSSIYALAKKLGRHYKNVHTDVTALVQLGIIEKDAEGKVFVPWDEIDVNMPLAQAA